MTTKTTLKDQNLKVAYSAIFYLSYLPWLLWTFAVVFLFVSVSFLFGLVSNLFLFVRNSFLYVCVS